MLCKTLLNFFAITHTLIWFEVEPKCHSLIKEKMAKLNKFRNVLHTNDLWSRIKRQYTDASSISLFKCNLYVNEVGSNHVQKSTTMSWPKLSVKWKLIFKKYSFLKDFFCCCNSLKRTERQYRTKYCVVLSVKVKP